MRKAATSVRDLGARVVKEVMKEDLKEIHWEVPNRHLAV
jgi:hypothetical protein